MESVSEHDLNVLGEEFAGRLRNGERPTMTEFTNRFADECAEEIEEFLESIAMLEGMKQKKTAAPKRPEVFPREFGRYEIESSLGEGGMGTVYLAHDSQLDRKVALKTPKFDQNSDPNLMARFHREAKSAGTLRHPNICPVYDVGQINGIHYISMAYIEGRPLSDYVHSGKEPSVSSAIRIIRKVALALHEAHSNGLIHRDLKPANIMIDARNEPIVMDFGLARQFGDVSNSPSLPVPVGAPDSGQKKGFEARLTQEGTIVGSPGYMSPEQLLGDHSRVGPASDVYALGAMFFELLTGQLPFPGDGSLISIVQAVIAEDPPDASMIRPAVNAQTVAVCRKAMAKHTEDRFQSMQTFAVALTTLLKSKDEIATGPRADDLLLKATSPELVRIEEQYKLSKSLYQEGQYAAAVSIMEKMVETAGQPNQFTTWAGKELPKAKAKAIDVVSRNTVTRNTDTPNTAVRRTRTALDQQDEEFQDIDLSSDELSTDDSETKAFTVAPTQTKNRRNRKQGRRLQNKITIAVVGLVVFLLIGDFVRNIFVSDQRPEATEQLASTAPDDKSGETETAKDQAGVEEPGDGDPGDGPPGRRFGAGRQPVADRIWRLDANGDLKLSKAELSRVRPLQGGPVSQLIKQFDQFDRAPRDGFLEGREVQMLLRALPRPSNRETEGRDNSGRRRPGQ